MTSTLYKIPQSVLVVIYTPSGQVLLIRRADAGTWQSVTGSKDFEDEDWADTAARLYDEQVSWLTLLAEAGSDRAHLLSAQIWLKDIEKDFAAMNDAWSRWLPAGCAPARATVEARLASADVRVEIMVTAVRKPA